MFWLYTQNAMTRYKVPAFGHWNFNLYDDIPISQFFESARDYGLIRARFFEGDGEDLFEMLRRKKGRDGARKKRNYKKEKVRKPKPVDEDLYMIPPQLLYQMPKKASKFFSYSQSEYVGKHYSFSEFW
ncbi:hypothetical protein BHE74_00030444 [Ensete ventricosum]|nr:hypothetical protein BHE74_00030444 [Ensete ventricosum]